jgi:Glycosyl transferase family 2
VDPRAANSGVLVTYNSAAAVAVTLPRLCEQLAAGDQLVVVDNASSDDTVAVVRDVAPGAEIVRMERNSGFAARGQSAMREHADGGPARHGGGGADAACHPMNPVLLPEQAAVVTAAVGDAGPLLGARAQPSRVPTCDWAVAREISRSESAWPRDNALADRRSIRDPSRSRSSAWYAAGFALVRVVQRLLTGRLGRACWCRAAPSWTTCGGYRAP